jgi:hypothetical protein
MYALAHSLTLVREKESERERERERERDGASEEKRVHMMA